MGQFEAALQFYEKASELRPLYPEAHCNMRSCCETAGASILPAIACYERWEGGRNEHARTLKTTQRRSEGEQAEGASEPRGCMVWPLRDRKVGPVVVPGLRRPQSCVSLACLWCWLQVLQTGPQLYHRQEQHGH